MTARPWAREVGLFLLAYLLYSAGRFIAVGDVGVAIDNARAIDELEAGLRVDVEGTVQSAFDGTAALWVLNHLYLAAQLIVVPGALVWLYRRSPKHYALLRNTVLATWLISLPIYELLPVAPPRLADIGLVDTITTQTGVALDSKLTTSFYNEYAAVPSLHAGFALAVSAGLAAVARGRGWKLLAWLWAPTIALAVVATGNHFVTDIAAGIAVTIAGFGLASVRVFPGGAGAPPGLYPPSQACGPASRWTRRCELAAIPAPAKATTRAAPDSMIARLSPSSWTGRTVGAGAIHSGSGGRP
jgi:PAP2 superfamily